MKYRRATVGCKRAGFLNEDGTEDRPQRNGNSIYSFII